MRPMRPQRNAIRQRHRPTLRPQTTKKATTILRSRKLSAVYALLVVYIAALCGWDLHANHDPINILLNAISLITVTILVYGLARE